MQKEIKEKIKLLDKEGRLIKTGYSKKMLYEYNRENIKASAFAKKEWDFYQVITGDYVLKMTIGNISYVGDFSAELFNVKTKEKFSFSRMKLLPFESVRLPRNPETPSLLKAANKDFEMYFEVTKTQRHLVVNADDKKTGKIAIDIYLNNDVDNEKMVIATPFEKKNKFYLNCKENYFGGHGKICFGEKCVELDETSTAVLDWGRGVWPFSQEWFWGNGATFIDGNKFGFNIGWGFGDLQNATENMFFWNGKAHKLGKLITEVDVNDYFKPWKFRDEEGKFEFTLTPVYDKLTNTKIGFIQMYCHQMFGRYDGYVVLPDGKKIEVKNMLAFCEHAKNRW